ncbi:metalloprotease [Drepanopeziza brunnea f. sp. 'multigermtubi' MB_m1]|uniref:Metalloprotease n=1 Tax=Marssonina brunnea f. sp. multigermtubi (strain MB_m1) TaxID=1072389 RepID=K1WMU6_MARBU|nr:metalloprotease [Drepanopeziza brunnea f. sp. 'multigermtubi' MB_m1]EKD14151.1 metalloprotease [Drepanopeziza brunnea f. sp. 'multigermtubi' MB_m1]
MFQIALLTALLASAMTAVTAHPQPRAGRPSGCGTVEPPADFVQAVSQMVEFEANATTTESSRRATVTVDTYVHVVARSTSLSGGYVPASQIARQIEVMNEHYTDAGFVFNLVDTDWTVNRVWAADGNDIAMKTALRQGSYSALNLYFQYDVSGYLGYCTFPTNAATGSTAFYTTPGGTFERYNLGGTATHEVGHWMGLYHVFQGGCSGSGDGIADTPPQAVLTDGCPTGQDSCAGGGVDSIHNYMDYSDDACYESFTPNQITRMANFWSQYRA